MLKFSKSKKAHIRLGRTGEKFAAGLLAKKGMEILARDFRTKQGELDIVARDGGMLVFVEVKTLRKIGKYRPVDNYKIKQIHRNYAAGREYLRRIGNPEIRCRFDFIEVVYDFFRLREIRHYQRFI